MSTQSQLDAIRILLGALSTQLAGSDPKIKAHLCMELVKAQDAATLTKNQTLALELQRLIDLLGCRKYP